MLRQLRLLFSVSCVLLKVAFAHSGLQCINPSSSGHNCHLLIVLPVKHSMLFIQLLQGIAGLLSRTVELSAQSEPYLKLKCHVNVGQDHAYYKDAPAYMSKLNRSVPGQLMEATTICLLCAGRSRATQARRWGPIFTGLDRLHGVTLDQLFQGWISTCCQVVYACAFTGAR